MTDEFTKAVDGKLKGKLQEPKGNKKSLESSIYETRKTNLRTDCVPYRVSGKVVPLVFLNILQKAHGFGFTFENNVLS